MHSFTEFFDLHLEEISVDRVRQVKKAFNKVAKKNKTPKFKPGTFGFDIEFDYESDPNISEKWMHYMQNKGEYTEEFHAWLSTEYGIEEPEDLSDWEHDNPEPKRVQEKVCPNPSDYDEGESDPLYREDLDEWEAYREAYEEYTTAIEEWEEIHEKVEEAMDKWNKHQDKWWKEYAEYTSGEAMDVLDIQTTDHKLEEYGKLLDRLGESWKMADEHEDYTTDWNLSVDETTGNPPEIASRILTYKDMGLVREFIHELRYEKTSNGTSAHIHIGLPKDFDAFSVLTLFQLVDEKYIEKRLPTRMFRAFAKFSSNTTKKIEDIILPLIKGGESLWYRTNNRTKVKTLISSETKRINSSHQLNIYYANDGTISNLDDMNMLKKWLKNKDIKITYKRKYGADTLIVRYEYLNEKAGPFSFEEIELERPSENTIVIDDDIIQFLIDRITEKMSGVNLSYFKNRKVIEFRYLSSEILEEVDEFLQFVNYFLFVPHVAQKAKRVRMDDMILRKMEDGKIQISAE